MKKNISLFLFYFLLISAFFPFSETAFSKSAETWQEWYIYSRNKQPVGYYVEETSIKQSTNEYQVQQSIIEKSSEGIQNIYVTSVANNDTHVKPLSFYVKRRTKSTIDIYEGIASNLDLGIRIHYGSQNSPPETNIIKLTNSSILGTFTPIYLARIHASGKITEKKSATFQALLEEGNDGKYELSEMKATLKGKKIKIMNETCNEFRVLFNKIEATWWVTSTGKLCKMIIPSLGAELQITNETTAKKFL